MTFAKGTGPSQHLSSDWKDKRSSVARRRSYVWSFVSLSFFVKNGAIPYSVRGKHKTDYSGLTTSLMASNLLHTIDHCALSALFWHILVGAAESTHLSLLRIKPYLLLTVEIVSHVSKYWYQIPTKGAGVQIPQIYL